MATSNGFVRACLPTLLSLSLIGSSSASAGAILTPPQSRTDVGSDRSCDLSKGTAPDCFKERLTPVVKVLLTHYGSVESKTDLARIGALLKERFDASTDGILSLEIVDIAQIPLKNYKRDVSELEKAIKGDESKRSPERLRRLWYYYQNDPYGLIIDEIQDELLKGGYRNALAESDAVLSMTEPQFEAIGYASGAYGVTEQPSEVAWMTSDGGWTQMEIDERIVDELLHEVGHLLGLDHAAARCSELPYPESQKCCQTSPGANDVMSYCRDRSRVRGPFYYRYTSCTKDYLQNSTLPALLSGGKRPFQAKPCD